MKISEIKEIIKLFDESQINSLKIEQEGLYLKLDKRAKGDTATQERVIQQAIPIQAVTTTQDTLKAPESIPAPQPETKVANASNADFITSPMVGTFYRSPSPGAAPYVSVGDTIKKGQTIGIVEAMKIMNEIEAEFDCKIIEIEVNDAQPVEYGTKLVMVERI